MTNKMKNIVTVVTLVLFLGGLSIWGLLAPDMELSEAERRPLAQFPELSVETLLSGKFMSEFERYSADQFPLRDQFRTLKAIVSYELLGKKDNNDVYIEDGYASELEYPLDEKSLDYAAERFKFLYDSFMKDTDVKLYLSVIPDKNRFLAEQNGYPTLDYEEFYRLVREKNDYMSYIDVDDLLSIDDYYYTDIHWRQEKIVDVAQRLASAMGVEITDDFTVNTLDKDYYGVYYGYAALPMPPETVYYLTNDAIDGALTTNGETSTAMDVYDMDKGLGKDPYELFLSGSLSLITIENPDADTDKELVIFRDSFGSSIAPLLLEGYSKVTLVDIRYLMSNFVGSLIDFDDQDVLFLYSVPVLNNSVTLK